MKKKNILSLIFLLTILCGFNSCEDKPLDPIEDPEYILCNGSGWFDEYTDIDNFYCTQRLFSILTAGAKRLSPAISDFRMTMKNWNLLFGGNGMTTTEQFIWNTLTETIFTLTTYIYITMNYPVI